MSLLGRTHLSAHEIAMLELDGLPTSKRGVHLLAERSGWAWVDRPGRGGGRIYAVADLPQAARRDFADRWANATPTATRGRPKGTDFFTANPDVAIAGATPNDADVVAISNALVGRYGIRTAFDANIVLIGDSIGEGVRATDTMALWHYLKPQLYKTSDYYNLGISGKYLAQCYRDRASYEARLVKAGKINIAVIQAGINDLHAAGTPANTLYSSTLTPYVSYLKGLGYTVAVATILPQTASNGITGNIADVEAQRIAYNNLLRGNTAGADRVIDLAADAHMGPYPAAPNDPTLYPDKIHPSSLGYSYLASVYAAGLNTFLL